ncbi:MAG TPA: YbaK/EbsC family protein [Streptosporangiaceae bacterium]|nr:YbaK/EbsC family protein [Streptosporangiaceae bacterium]
MISSPVAAVEAALRAAGVEPELRTFTESVPTAVAAAAALGCEVGAIANSLVFAQVGPDEQAAPLLVLASGAHRVDTAGLAQRLGTGKIRRASPEFVLEHTGQQVGGVAPVGHPGPVPTVIDADLAQFGVLWAGGGDKYTMFATSFDDLVAMTGGTVLPVA